MKITKNEKDIDIKRLSKAATLAFENSPVIFAYLYGSRARGKFHAGSDIDIAVYYDEKKSCRISKELELALIIEKETGYSPIDLRSLNSRPLSFRGNVIKEGIIIYSCNEIKRIRFERETMHEYLEYLPHLKKLSENYLKRVADKGIL